MRDAPTESELHRAERCAATHEALAAGRTAQPPRGGAYIPEFGGFVYVFHCPHCQKTIDSTPAQRDEVKK